MKRWSCDRSATFDVIWRNMMWHDVTWHDGARRDMMWHDMTWRDVTWRDITWYGMTRHGVAWRDMRYITWHDVEWRDMTRHDVKWREMTWYNATWRDMTRHDATWRDVTWHDVTWCVILISTQQEWTLLHVRWLRYCQKTIKTFLGLNLFTDIYTLSSCIDESQKDKKVEVHQNWVGKIVLKFNIRIIINRQKKCKYYNKKQDCLSRVVIMAKRHI